MVAIVLFLSTCLGATVEETAPSISAEDRMGITKTVFRSILKSWSGTQQLFFLGLDSDTDPPESLLRDLSDLRVRLRRGSWAKQVVPKDEYKWLYCDRATSEPGIMLKAHQPRKFEDGRVEIRVSVVRGIQNGHADTYVLRKDKAEWKVVEKKYHAVY